MSDILLKLTQPNGNVIELEDIEGVVEELLYVLTEDVAQTTNVLIQVESLQVDQ